MTKILLVEDDDNLRNIYGDRLKAEGYEIISTRDGEEALAMAVQEKPDLIIADVMMPKISGFDMLDILRSTKETKNTKVIMMTALSQKEDQERGQALGADRYLVKSQVTLEDVVRVAGEVINEGNNVVEPVDQPTPQDETPVPGTEIATAEPSPDAPATVDVAAVQTAETTTEEKTEFEQQIKDFGDNQAQQIADQVPVNQEVKAPESTSINVEDGAVDSAMSTIESTSVGGDRVINPVEPAEIKPDINELLAKEMANESSEPTPPPPPANPDEKSPDQPPIGDITL